MSAMVAAACPAAGRYARHRATLRWRGGGGRHGASWSDRGAGRAAGFARRRGDGRLGPRPRWPCAATWWRTCAQRWV